MLKSMVMVLVLASLLTAAVSGAVVIDAGVAGARPMMWLALLVYLCAVAAFGGLLAIEYRVMRSAARGREAWLRWP
jgi:hypothetical protein